MKEFIQTAEMNRLLETIKSKGLDKKVYSDVID
jgi:hypothetical protein